MGDKIFCKTVFILFILLLGIVCTGCEEGNEKAAKSLNDTELLITGDVVKALNENGANLTEATDFPIDLSSCKISGKTPQSFLSGETGVYYMFYEYDGYSETSELKKLSAFFEYPNSTKEYVDSLIPAGIAGKNLYVFQWHPEIGIWKNGKGPYNHEVIDPILEERAQIMNILRENAFNEKTVVYTGNSESWEVKIPVEYIYNVRKNEAGMPEILFDSEGKTYVKYLAAEKEPLVVKSMRWNMIGGESSLTYDKGEGSILSKQSENGFYKAASTLGNCNPEEIESITVTIICDNGDTEEIACTIAE